MHSISKRSLADLVLICLLAAVLIKPLFKLGFTDKWGSVEGAIISDARFLSDHWPNPSWQPLWYAGARYDSLFPPAVRYGTVAIAKIGRVPVVRAYHTYLALFYCLGIGAVYFLIWTLMESRWSAWCGAAAAALISPCFLFLPELRNDAWLWVPQRLGAMMRYGDGPHIVSLAALPVALAFWSRALQRFRRIDVVPACLSGAVVAANSLTGAATLAVLFPLMLWSLYVTHVDRRIWNRAAVIAALTWGLSAFWLVPSMLTTSLSNTQWLSPAGTTWSLWIALACGVVFVVVTNGKFRGRADLAGLLFVCGAAFAFALNVAGNYYFGFQLAGAPMHLAPELDLFLILAAAEGLRRLRPRRIALGIAFVALATSGPYLRRAWHVYPSDLGFKERAEYKIQEWASQNLPDARLMVAGPARYWIDAWGDRKQLGGESDSGPPEPLLKSAQFQILRGDQPALAVLWMQLLGVDAVVTDVGGKFAGVLPPMLGDVVYRVPRRFSDLARVVNTDGLNSLQEITANNDLDGLKAHYAVFENGPDSHPSVVWDSTDRLRIHARIEAGQSLVVQTNYADGWHAYADGKSLPVREGALGFIRLDPPPGDQTIRMVFETPLEVWLGRGITLASLLVLMRLRRREAV
ncbi:MAG: hypothetical protein ABJF23_13950 [Bryobacteraceae bacterium]